MTPRRSAQSSSTQSAFELRSVFFQANTIHGFTFFDDSGKILNLYVDNYQRWTNGLDGLKLTEPKADSDVPDTVQVTPDRVWFQYLEQSSLGSKLSQMAAMLVDISRILKVDEYSRLGLRASYFFSTPPDSDLARLAARRALGAAFDYGLEQADAGIEFEAVMRAKSRDISTVIWAKTLKILRPPRNRGDYETDGLSVDVDAYREGTLRSNANIIRRFLFGAATDLAGDFVEVTDLGRQAFTEAMKLRQPEND
jgi:hypothetical protein